MRPIDLDRNLFADLQGKTGLITGAAGGIGAALVRLLASHGANVVLVDLPSAEDAANSLIASLPNPSQALFAGASTTDWNQLKTAFRQATIKFGGIHLVIANAGVMEREPTLDMDATDEDGELLDATEASRVIDINMKGTLATLRLGMFHMRSNSFGHKSRSRGSIVLVNSTSGYFGATGVAGYVSSKHGLTGLLRASQPWAEKYDVQVNAIAPFVTLGGSLANAFAARWETEGLPRNSSEHVAEVAISLALNGEARGECYLACGTILREVENTRREMLGEWVGDDFSALMAQAARFFEGIGGYPLPR